MVAGAQEDPGHAEAAEAIEQRLVQRDDGGSVDLGQIHQRVVRRIAGFDRPELPCEPKGGPGVPVSLRQDSKFIQDRTRHGDIDVAEESTQFGLEVDPELERHEERIRVEEDDSGHVFVQPRRLDRLP